MGMGLMGVRVSTSTPLEGFTLTREDGWFDLLVNGGGAVTLQFGRSPFRPQSHIVNVPWNEVREFYMWKFLYIRIKHFFPACGLFNHNSMKYSTY
jgi:hypothetical protein